MKDRPYDSPDNFSKFEKKGKSKIKNKRQVKQAIDHYMNGDIKDEQFDELEPTREKFHKKH